MTRDPRYDILFEPIQLGPVTAKNRFYQVPHCTGMGHLRPRTLAEMRRTKAKGGWGVICTEYNSIHPSSDDLPTPSASLWNESDVRAHRLMTDAIHEYGALAGAELWYGGHRSANLMTRQVQMDLQSVPNSVGHPYQTRAMDKTDIRNLRRWHKKAALRARDAGFDIVYVYATHGYLLANMLNPRVNTRSDEYGGSLENRTRLIRELIEETKEAVGDRCAVACRFSADEYAEKDGVPIHGEHRDMFEMMAELPDIWDVNISDYSLEMGVSRYVKEGALEPYMDFVKSVTTKPVVTVGRFTSPDTMVSQIKRGVLDMIGAARPSIADPYLPSKIERGALSEIRECIGCNICYSGDSTGTPIRCTQNPTMGEEWRRGWNPEEIAPAKGDESVLIVGSGPAGLEAARALGQRGYTVMLAEAGTEIGGRVTREATLPGMSEYIRVRDYRQQQLQEMVNVDIFLDSHMGCEEVMEVGADHVAIATGAKWRRDRYDGEAYVSVAAPGTEPPIFTPDDIINGVSLPEGPVLVYDEDHYYMGGVIAEAVRAQGHEVTLCTDSDSVSRWAGMTSERWRVRTNLIKMGVGIATAQSLSTFDGQTATLACTYSGHETTIEVAAVVLVTQRAPTDDLYQALMDSVEDDADKLPFTLKRIGDCEAPAIVAAAVYAGHRYARELGETVDIDDPMRHDRIDVGDTPEGRYLMTETTIKSAAETFGVTEKYLETLTLYYEEEVEGEAYFGAIADRLDDPAEKHKMQLMADVETYAAASVRPLLDKYGLTPRPGADLRASGRASAAESTGDFAHFMAEWRKSFPAYMDDFHGLEALAPEEDLPLLKVLTNHEIAAIDFLELEAKGDADSTKPMERYLETGEA